MITVRTPDGQVFRFPEGMTQEQMSAAIQRHYQRGQQQPQQSQAEPDRSFGSAFSYALDAPLENMAKTANTVGAQGVGQFLSNLTEAPENYQSASAEFMNEGGAGYKLSALPRAAVEQAGQFAGSVASRGVGALLGGAAGSVIPGAGTLGGAGVGAFLGPALFEGIQVLGPVAQERARNNGRETPNAEDFLFAASTATGSGALNAIAPGLSGIFKRILAEGGTEALQSAIQQTGETVATDAGLQISPKEAIGEGIIGGTSAGGVTAITNTVGAAGNVVLRKPEELSPEVRQAAADVARDLQETAQENKLNLADIERASTRGADQALDNVRAKYRAEIKANNKVLLKEIGERLNESDKAQLAELIRQAGTKVGEAAPAATPKGSIEFVLSKFGDTTEGQALANAIHKSNVVTELYASGLHGGVSQFTDLFNPLNVVQRSYDPGRVIRGGLSGYTALSTSGASIPIQMGIVGAGRAIDAMTGRRSKVRKFIQKNRKQDGLATPMGVTVEGRKARLKAQAKEAQKAAKKAEEAENAAANVEQWKKGLAPVASSPRGVTHTAVVEADPDNQMTPSERDTLIDSILNDTLANTDSDIIKKAIKRYRGMLQTGRANKKGNPLNTITGIIKPVIAAQARARMQQQGKAQGQGGSGPSIPVAPRDPRVQEGIEGNRQALSDLRAQMEADQSINTEDRAALTRALDELSLPLGKTPQDVINNAKRILAETKDALSDKGLADTYVKPYVDRVVRQQSERMRREAKKNGTDSGSQGGNNQGVGGTSAGNGGLGTARPIRGVEDDGRSVAGPESSGGGIAQPPRTQQVGRPNESTTQGNQPQNPPSQTPTVKPNPPTKTQADQGKVQAKAVLEIGKAGTPFENGIQNFDEAVKAAEALGITVRIYNSGTAMYKANKGDGRNYFGMARLQPHKGSYAATILAVREGGSVDGKRDPVKRFHTLLHEFAHTINAADVRNQGRAKITSTNRRTGMPKDTLTGSFDHDVMRPILTSDPLSTEEVNDFGSYAPSLAGDPKLQQAMIGEIIAAQDNAFVSKTSDPNKKVPLRENAAAARALVVNRRYLENYSELSVEPVLTYLMNPQLAQEIFPISTRVIRDYFNKAENSKIRFYEVASEAQLMEMMDADGSIRLPKNAKFITIPFAAVLGLVIASMTLSGEDEERGVLAAA